MRLGLNIEYDGKNYDVLELPNEAFVCLLPCMTPEQYNRIDRRFEDVWPDVTVRRNHILAFTAERVHMSVDYVLLYRGPFWFDDDDLDRYIQAHTMQGYRPC
ncbi:hypothetical protein [Alicyclobacillus vulcanalis]|uniref:Uncharacterized protein n=1 Tax=Alicyclobacillus vulcanalis TaxID=252246 RepID=A0A1N7KBT3_9BACL|nr:hypothetical protein [Alicyclobacillus vulcanalis]SIS58970.1 hypothetical protein SAMN05421799_101459 [Alicyclobacillus vulcanalis]